MNPQSSIHAAYRGRFAPSPTGDLHPGSLVAALGSLLDARSHGGEWLVRVEDIDQPREVEGSAKGILQDLTTLGFRIDQAPMFQSQRHAAYQLAVEQLLDEGKAFWCGCARSDLPASGIYPGTCREGLPAGKKPRAVRVRVDDRPIHFDDRLQGSQTEVLSETTGDFVIRRADGLFAYQLAVVVDDAEQGITDVVRGADLLTSTARQIHLQKLLGQPRPRYLHLPLVLGGDGAKLAMSRQSSRLLHPEPLQQLLGAMDFLGFRPEQPIRTLAEFRRWAEAAWDPARINPRNRPWPAATD